MSLEGTIKMDAVPELYDIVSIYLVLYLAINMVAAIPSIFIALKCNKNLTINKESNARGYRWGYFTGFRLVFVYAFILLWVFPCIFYSGSIADRQGLFVVVFFCVFFVSLGLSIIKRQRTGWVIYTVFTFNPLLWVVNTVYIMNRLGEFAAERASASSENSD